MRSLLFLFALVGASVTSFPGHGHAQSSDPIEVTRQEHIIAGWSVHVDERLSRPPHDALGERAIELITADLTNIATVVPAKPLAKLRAVPIVVDLDHGELTSMQYHPSAKWLAEHGYARTLARCAHIPVASGYTAPRHRWSQPWCLLHELAHGYHDQVLGFEEPRVRAVWQRYVESGHGEQVAYQGGGEQRHYALTNHKEFFAEMTEAYFGMNDFFPFNTAELQTAEPETHALLRAIWGPVPPKP